MPRRHSQIQINYAGLRIGVQSADAQVLEIAKDCFTRSGCSPCFHEPENITVRLAIVQRILDLQERLALDFSIAFPKGAPSRHGVRIYTEGAHIFLRSEALKTLARIDADGGLIEGWIEPNGSDTAAILRQHFHCCLQCVLVFQGVHFIHAAGVSKDGCGVVIVGASGQGKSTSVLRLVASGFRYLSDDQLGLRFRNGQVEMICSLEWPAVWRSTLELLGPLKERILGCSPPSSPRQHRLHPQGVSYKIEVPMEQLFPGSLAITCRPRVLVFLSLQPEAWPVLKPVGKAEALYRLLEDSALPAESGSAVTSSALAALPFNYLSLLFRLVEDTAAYTLTYSMSCLDMLPSLIEQCLGDGSRSAAV